MELGGIDIEFVDVVKCFLFCKFEFLQKVAVPLFLLEFYFIGVLWLWFADNLFHFGVFKILALIKLLFYRWVEYHLVVILSTLVLSEFVHLLVNLIHPVLLYFVLELFGDKKKVDEKSTESKKKKKKTKQIFSFCLFYLLAFF